MRRTLVRHAAGALLVLLGGAGGAAAQDAITLTFAHWLPPRHPIHAAIVAWVKSVEDASGGTRGAVRDRCALLSRLKDCLTVGNDDIGDVFRGNWRKLNAVHCNGALETGP